MSKMIKVESCQYCEYFGAEKVRIGKFYCTHPKMNLEDIKDPSKILTNCLLDDNYSDKLHKIITWCEAYPLDRFPEPDLKKAYLVLKENGISLGAITASNMRHVLTGIQNIIEGEECLK